jgi:hypothetical protein
VLAMHRLRRLDVGLHFEGSQLRVWIGGGEKVSVPLRTLVHRCNIINQLSNTISYSFPRLKFDVFVILAVQHTYYVV